MLGRNRNGTGKEGILYIYSMHINNFWKRWKAPPQLFQSNMGYSHGACTI
jgi:hypothetical protein